MPPNLLQRPILPHIILCDIREHHVHIRIQPLIPPPRQPSAYARAGERATQTDGDEAYTAEETTHRECTHQLLVTLHQYYSSRATREPCETKREENVRTIINRINAPPTPTTHPRHTHDTPHVLHIFDPIHFSNRSDGRICDGLSGTDACKPLIPR